MKKLIIFGNAEIASLAKFYFTTDSEYEVVAFTVDDEYCDAETYEGLPLVPYSQLLEEYPPNEYEGHVALSYQKLNKLREEKYLQLKNSGYRLASYVCSKYIYWPDLTIGDNCFILENQTIQPTVKIGNNVMIWSGNHLGHGTQIKDHTYISSHVVISGHCTLGERCFLGVNASIKDFIEIGDDCMVGMGADVTKNMPSGSIAISDPAKMFSTDDRMTINIKKTYFGL